jgi:pimeloyl-ACP methyl ester carboxylesterase
MPEIRVRGRKICFGAQPEAFDRSALAILFIHGTGGDRDDWKAQLEGLSDSVTVIALELPGHGTSERPGEATVVAYAGWVSDFVKSLALKKVVVVGNSLGSAITLWLALYPEPWLAGIGLVGAGARLRVHPAFLEGVCHDKAKAMDMMTDSALGAAPEPALRKAVYEKFMANPAEIIHGDLAACNGFDVMEGLQQISLPTAIVVGQDDRLTPVKYSQLLHEALPGSHMTVIPGAGHLVMLERPAEFNDCMRHFLASLPKEERQHDLLLC